MIKISPASIAKDKGQFYRSIHDATDAKQNCKFLETPSIWICIDNLLEEFPDWVQPIGVHDAYAQGARVPDINGNIWAPGIAG